MSEQSAEKDAIIGQVNIACEYCGGRFAYTPGLVGGVGIGITVERIGDECVRHSARVIPPEVGQS